MKFNLCLSLSVDIHLKCIIELNVEHENIKPLEENIGERLCEPGLGKDIVRYNTKSMIHKTTN